VPDTSDRMTDEEFERYLHAMEAGSGGLTPTGDEAFAARVRELQANLAHVTMLEARAMFDLRCGITELARLRARRAVRCPDCDVLTRGLISCMRCHGTGATWEDPT
jgi:hypothetical protein